MSILAKERLSDSPFIETVTRGRTISEGSSIRPAESHWHMVFVQVNGGTMPIVVGPLRTAGIAAWGAGAEILWVKFKLGTFMPHLPARKFIDVETRLPEATRQSFWLQGSAWQFPDFENIETFVERLAREEILVSDPLVRDALQDYPTDVSPRTLAIVFFRRQDYRKIIFDKSSAPVAHSPSWSKGNPSSTPLTSWAISINPT
ncbi:MAG TPA: AraC family transcriptional regulator [Anaerolineae bacterium]|nr:AraC family transcriptional regulator [Anaerolineae bacterium]